MWLQQCDYRIMTCASGNLRPMLPFFSEQQRLDAHPAKLAGVSTVPCHFLQCNVQMTWTNAVVQSITASLAGMPPRRQSCHPGRHRCLRMRFKTTFVQDPHRRMPMQSARMNRVAHVKSHSTPLGRNSNLTPPEAALPTFFTLSRPICMNKDAR